MTSVLAGVFGRGAEAGYDAVRHAVDAEPDCVYTTRGLVLATVGRPGRSAPSDRRVVFVTGAIRNLAEIAAELDTPEPAPPVEHVLSLAFERWGEAALERLRGAFALVVWEPDTRTGILATDQLGVGGLFLHESDGRLAFGTEVRPLVDLLPRRPGPDPSAVAQWLTDGYLEPGDTLLEGVRRLEGGRLVRLRDDRWELATYWAPRYEPPAKRSFEEAVAAVRAGLDDAVRARLSPEGITGILLSGGLDSSTVAAVARGLVPAGGRLSAYTYVYPERPDLDESDLVELTVSRLGLGWERRPVPDVGTLPAALEYQRTWGIPAATPMLAFTQPLLERAARNGAAVILDGEGGDELFGCSPYLLADRLRRGDVRGAAALARLLPDAGPTPSRRELLAAVGELGVKGALPHRFHLAARRLAGSRRYAASWLTSHSARLYVEARDDSAWKRGSGPRWWAFLSHLVTTWREQMGAYDFFRHRDAQAGVVTQHPLLDDVDLIELVLRLAPELSFAPELNRPLERAVTAGMLPDEVRLRRDKSVFGELVVDAVGRADRELTQILLRAPDAELWRYAKPDAVSALLDVPAERRSIKWARVVGRLATTESWLRTQEDEELPTRLLERHG